MGKYTTILAMIYDCFTFFNELDLLEIRLNTLDKVVDKFIITEATVTHTNKPKPLYYEQNKSRFKKFKDKIIHVVIKDSPDVTTPMFIVYHQMASVTKGLETCKPKSNDTILISCVDEIPKPEKILEWKDKPGKHKVFLQSFSYYYLNCFDYITDGKWQGTQMYAYKDLLTYKDPHIARFTKPDVLISDGGWHFSNIGSVKDIQYELTATFHQEYNNDSFNTPEHIKRSIAEGKDFLNHGRKFKIVGIKNLPQYVQEHPKKFAHLLIDKFESESLLYSFELLYFESKKVLRLIYRNFRQWFENQKVFFNQ